MLSNEWFSIITTTKWSNWGSWSLPKGALGFGAEPTARVVVVEVVLELVELPACRVVVGPLVAFVDPAQPASAVPAAPAASAPSNVRLEILVSPRSSAGALSTLDYASHAHGGPCS
jgi:hypothetical protein